jgi:Rrf2 family protein
MANALAISEDASLAIHTMALLAGNANRRMSTAEIAGVLSASEHTLAKVLQKLSRVGLLESLRGPHGGFTLARPASETALLEIYEAVEGPLGPGACLLGHAVCGGAECVFGGLVQSIQKQLRDYFASTTLADLSARVTLGIPADLVSII